MLSNFKIYCTVEICDTCENISQKYNIFLSNNGKKNDFNKCIKTTRSLTYAFI